MSKAAQASIYEVLTIDKDGKEVNIQGKTTSFSYYESVLSPNITASLTFVDTGGSIAYDSNYDKQERLGSIYNALPITSGEKVKFRIRNSNLGALIFQCRHIRSCVKNNLVRQVITHKSHTDKISIAETPIGATGFDPAT